MVIQSVLAFILGFLIAGLLAILIAPAFRRRAERLTRQRLEATLPMSLNELQAERDKVRAHYALEIRRVEADAKTHKLAANEGLVEIARLRETLKAAEKATSQQATTIAEYEARITDQTTELVKEQENSSALKSKQTELERTLLEKSTAFEELSRLQEETSLVASNRQVDLLSRDAEVDRLSATIAQLRKQRGESESSVREQIAAVRRLEEDLKRERRRNTEQEKTLERLLRDLSDRDEEIAKRDRIQSVPADGTQVAPDSAPSELVGIEVEPDDEMKDLNRLRQDLRKARQSEEELRLQLTESQATTMRLEAELADNALEDRQPGPDLGPVIAKLEAERDRLEEKLLAFADSGQSTKPEDFRLLRSELAEFAAQMVHMTRMLEGPNSPIEAVLAKDEPLGASQAGHPSLADRIRALKADVSAAEASETVQSDR